MRTRSLQFVSLLTSVVFAACGPMEGGPPPLGEGPQALVTPNADQEAREQPVSMAEGSGDSGSVVRQLPEIVQGVTDTKEKGELPSVRHERVPAASSTGPDDGVTQHVSPTIEPIPRPPIVMKSPQELAIDAKYSLLGGSAGFLGPVVESLTGTPDGVGSFKRYVGGAIYYSPSSGAQQIGGAIRDKWSSLGWERSILGYPLTDERGAPDGFGRYNHFQGGSIYWSYSTGAHEVHGDIRERWASMGWERSILGYPLTDETVSPDGFGRYNHFQGGSVYWTPKTGAQEIHGAIRTRWAALGWERSFLGYPTSGVMTVPGIPGLVSFFERGSIIELGASGTAVQPASLDFKVDSIVFPDGTPVGGNAKLSVRADGSYSFEGHFHVSGSGCWDDKMLWVLRTNSGRVFTFAHQGKLSGTFCSGSRDDDWIETGTNNALRESFADLQAGWSYRWNASTGLSLSSMWDNIKPVIGYVKDVIAVAGPIIAAL